MPEPIDVYCDAFAVTVGPYGANLTFQLSQAIPEVTSPKLPERVATVRMSVEHLKTMAVIITRQIKKIESDVGVSYKVPTQVLAQLGIAPEDWDDFWSGKR
jgi:hypothetical protein